MANFAKLQEIFKNPEDMEALTKLTVKEDILAFLNEKGAEMTADELTEMGMAIKKAIESKGEGMNMDDMDAVAGGGFFTATFDFIGNLASIPSDFIADTVVMGVDKLGGFVAAVLPESWLK